MADDLTVWGVGTSRTMRVHWMLPELGLAYECHPIQSRTGETLTEEFTRLNLWHKIPVLRHGSLVLTESAAIIQYLSEIFPQTTEVYVPSDAVGRARLNEWCYFVMSELDAGSLYVVRRHDGLQQIYGEAPTAVASAKSYFLHNVEAMAARIGIDHTYVCGDRLSVADILLMTCLDWAASCGIALPETVSHYRRRVALRPAYQAALKKNFAEYKG
ncbi:MAG TPA: glutathione S-transferase family protein [Candidatus Binatia bacterium]|nr:glutathione S-transferase family protein [Candidatus Binatia bacterium]